MAARDRDSRRRHGRQRQDRSRPEFLPLILTPCSPSYPSNHASGSGGGAEALRRLYGAGGHDITLTIPSLPTIVLRYRTLNQLTDDVDDARVYGGIHFRFDQEAGNVWGVKSPPRCTRAICARRMVPSNRIAGLRLQRRAARAQALSQKVGTGCRGTRLPAPHEFANGAFIFAGDGGQFPASYLIVLQALSPGCRAPRDRAVAALPSCCE